jgi:hypothetical protein
MRRKKQIVTAALLSGSVALGAQSLFAQGAPGGGPSGPSSPGQTGPTVPQPGPTTPRQTQPTNPGQPAPGLGQSDPAPGQPGTVPGQRGTIPERVERPDTSGTQGTATASPENIKKAQDALKARGLNPGTDGKMDAKTQQALRDFQKANNLPVTGVLDQKTAQQLGITLEGQGSTPRSAPGGTTTQPGSGGTTTEPAPGSTPKQPGPGGTSTAPRP